MNSVEQRVKPKPRPTKAIVEQQVATFNGRPITVAIPPVALPAACTVGSRSLAFTREGRDDCTNTQRAIIEICKMARCMGFLLPVECLHCHMLGRPRQDTCQHSAHSNFSVLPSRRKKRTCYYFLSP